MPAQNNASLMQGRSHASSREGANFYCKLRNSERSHEAGIYQPRCFLSALVKTHQTFRNFSQKQKPLPIFSEGVERF